MFPQNSLPGCGCCRPATAAKPTTPTPLSVGIAARSARTLTSARVDGTVTAVRAVVEHRDDLVKTRTQTINRLHVVLTHLIPAGAQP